MLTSALQSARAKRARGEGGFTLIELLVVVVIIGVLVAIAIPLYLNYRKGAENKSLQSDVRGAVSTIEQCIGENNNTPPAAPTGNGSTGADLAFSCGGTTTGTGTNAQTTGATTETAKVGGKNKLTYTAGTGGYYSVVGDNGNVSFTYNTDPTSASNGKIIQGASTGN